MSFDDIGSLQIYHAMCWARHVWKVAIDDPFKSIIASAQKCLTQNVSESSLQNEVMSMFWYYTKVLSSRKKS